MPSDLEDQLIAIRRHWYDIAMGETFSATVEGTPNQFLPAVRKLAEAGRRLWVALFEREAKSAIYQIGQWLQEHPPARDSVIQVSVGSDAMDFVVPWSLIYDRPVPQKEYELPDIEGFWGIRYCVEQRLPKFMEGTEAPAASEPEIKMAFMLWEQFRNATEQKDLMRRLAARAPGKLEISDPPIVDATACYKLLADCDKHLLYFYTHGYTRLRESNLSGSDNLQPFLRWYESLPADSPLRAGLGATYGDITRHAYVQDRSWIGLTYGVLYLDQLYDEVKELISRPLVILNMCESAQVTPSLSDSFIDFFLDRGARGVIGTECSMTIEFANVFSESLLTGLLAGETIGTALLNARRKFIGLRNPLGLAYTLFGSAAASFAPPILVEEQPAPSPALES